jgi:hypothetical protein
VERGRIVDRAAEQPDDAEQQVGLLLGLGKRADEGEQFVIARDGVGQALIGRRHTAGFPPGEVGILGGRACVHGRHPMAAEQAVWHASDPVAPAAATITTTSPPRLAAASNMQSP